MFPVRTIYRDMFARAAEPETTLSRKGRADPRLRTPAEGSGLGERSPPVAAGDGLASRAHRTPTAEITSAP